MPIRDKTELRPIMDALGVTAVEDALALSPRNDPFFDEGHKRIKAEWFADVFKEYIKPAMEREGKRRMHLRGMHYKIERLGLTRPIKLMNKKGTPVVQVPYVNDEASWDYLVEASKHARVYGKVEPHWVLDNQTPMDPIYYRDTDEYELSIDRTTGDMALPTLTLKPLELDLPEPLVYNIGSVGAMQPYYLEVWVEKFGPVETLKPICRHYGATIIVNEGYSTITNIVAFIDRIRDYNLDKPIIIYYISDFDPAGDNMPYQVARYVEFWLEFYEVENTVMVEPLILTAEQVEEHTLPPKPKTRKKKTATGSVEELTKLQTNWNEKFGGGVELDAFEAEKLDAFKGVVADALRPFYDKELEGNYRTWKNDIEEDFEQRYADQVKPEYEDRLKELETQVNAVVESFQDEIDDLQQRLDDALGPFTEEFESIQSEHNDELDTLIKLIQDEVEAPEPDVEGDDIDWLFDGERDEITQLRQYVARRDVTRGDA